MKKVTVCTANIHNLFVLYKACFKAPGQFHYEEVPQGYRYLPAVLADNQLLSCPESRKLAALALKRGGESLPDVVVLQEVESMAALEVFNKSFLDDVYPNTMLVSGHNERLVNIGVMSMYPIISVTSHKDEKDGQGEYLFSRDCLEVAIDVNECPLTVFANHFKSHYGRDKEERAAADEKRQKQGERVAEIVSERFPGKQFETAAFVVIGDLNDAPDTPALEPLMGIGLEDVLDRLPEDERWTHYWAARNIVSRFDYILLGPALSKSSPETPYIERRGLPVNRKEVAHLRSSNDISVPVDFDRFPEVDGKVFASDHAFVFFTIVLPDA